MAFNFDSCPERAGTDSTKWHKYHGRDVIPCWIADMDFESAPAIVEAVKARAAHGGFGYPAQRMLAWMPGTSEHMKVIHSGLISQPWRRRT